MRPGREGRGTGSFSQRMSNRYESLHADAPMVVTERTCAYSAYGAFPVNHGSVMLIETAGILIGAIFMLTVSSPDSPSPPAPGELGSFAFVGSVQKQASFQYQRPDFPCRMMCSQVSVPMGPAILSGRIASGGMLGGDVSGRGGGSSFTLSQMGRLDSRARSYLLLNLTGSLTLAGDAAVTSQWGFLLLEGAWAVVSAIGLIRAQARRPSAKS